MSEPVPQRIGDAERDRAAEYLRDHMSVGRLTQDEFDERLSAALQARTAADLAPLFADLPAPKPGQESGSGQQAWPQYPATTAPAAVPAAGPGGMPSRRLATTLNVVSGLVWPAWILVCFAFGWHLWWLVFIPIMVSSVAGKQHEELRRREKLSRRRQDPQLPPGDGDQLR